MLGWPAVCDCGISWPYSIIFETVIIVNDNTIVLNNIILNYKSALAKTSYKSSENQRQMSLVFVGFEICYILVLESAIGISYSVLY